MKIPYYAGDIQKIKPVGYVELDRVLKAIKEPKPENVELIERIRNAKDEKIKSDLKKQLFAFTPCVIVENRRAYADIKEFTGYLSLDFDKLPDRNYSENLKNALFYTYDWIIAVWLSSSGKGCRAIVKIPIVQTVDEFKQYFAGIQQLLGDIEGFDKAPKNPVLPMFYSIDTNLLQRENAKTFTRKFVEIESKPIQQYVQCYQGKEKLVEAICKSAIDKIVDNGHPQLRAISYALGGYVSSGYISEHDSIYLITNLIKSNSYLSKKPDTYIKTAKVMIVKGQQQPIYFKENGY